MYELWKTYWGDTNHNWLASNAHNKILQFHQKMETFLDPTVGDLQEEERNDNLEAQNLLNNTEGVQKSEFSGDLTVLLHVHVAIFKTLDWENSVTDNQCLISQMCATKKKCHSLFPSLQNLEVILNQTITSVFKCQMVGVSYLLGFLFVW